MNKSGEAKSSSSGKSKSGGELKCFFFLKQLFLYGTVIRFELESISRSMSQLVPKLNEPSDDYDGVQVYSHRQIRGLQFSFALYLKNLILPASILTLSTLLGKSGSGMSDKLKLKLKGGGVVDPDSGLEDKAHVLKTKNALYSVVLGIVDIQSGRNSYYKLQVLEHDKKSK